MQDDWFRDNWDAQRGHQIGLDAAESRIRMAQDQTTAIRRRFDILASACRTLRMLADNGSAFSGCPDSDRRLLDGVFAAMKAAGVEE